jgi:hypothetical protein
MSFHNPPVAYRLAPFWFWNDDLDPQEIIHQIQQMAEQGIGGFFICARQGLTVPYLSNQWFQFVAVAIEAAQQYGLDVWLYDEYPYPSGMSGGEVILQHPDARHRQLLHHTLTVSGPQTLSYDLPWAKLLSAQAVPLEETTGSLLWSHALDLTSYIGSFPAEEVFQSTGLTTYTNKRYFTASVQKRLLWDVPPGRWTIVIFLEKELDDFKYFGTYVDPCHKEAMQTFIATTHEQYSHHFQQHFGATIKGLFTDEVGLLSRIPWSPHLLPFFRQQYGYDLIDALPALFYPHASPQPTPVGTDDADAQNNLDPQPTAGTDLSCPPDNTPQIKYQFFQSLHRLLNETYHQPVSAWCAKHHLQYTTEVQSMRMTTQLYSHMPGGDSAHEKVGRSLEWILDHNASSLRADPKIISSLAHQLGAERAMIECFHSVGWSMTLQDAKWMLDRLAALGINFFVFHAFFYSISGLRKHDAPPSQFLQNPYWTHFRHLADYAARLSYTMSQGRASTAIAIVHPATSFWTHMGNPFHSFKYCGDDPAEEHALEQLKQDWTYLCKQLLLHQIDFDHLDPEMLVQACIEDAQLVIGQARYQLLILPPITNLEASAWSQVKAFLQAGGTVISVGLLPYEHIDSTPSIEAEALAHFGLTTSPRQNYWPAETNLPYPPFSNDEHSWTKGHHSAYFIPTPGGAQHPRTIERLLALLQQCIPPAITWEPLLGDRNSFLAHQRSLPDGSQLVFITHQEGTAKKLYLHLVQCPAGQVVELLDLASGLTTTIPTEKTANGYSILLSFAPYESHLLRYSPSLAMLPSAGTDLSCPSLPFSGGPTDTINRSLRSSAEHPQEDTLAQEKSWVLTLDIEQPWKLTAQQDNILRFANFRFALDHNDIGSSSRWYEGQASQDWPLVEAKALINQCADLAAGQTFPLQFKQSFGSPVHSSLAYPLRCWYQTTFSVAHLPPTCKLIMDKDAIGGNYTLYLNGHKITAQDFIPISLHGYPQQGCEVQQLLKPGTNHLVVHVEAQSAADGVRDPLYLSGPFGLSLDAAAMPTIGKVPQTGKLQSGIQEGYPYFAGTLSFTKDISIEAIPSSARTFILELQGWDPHIHDCVEILINGHSLGVCCWSPYHWEGESAILRTGINTVEIRLTNTLSAMLEGSYFDDASHQIIPIF